MAKKLAKREVADGVIWVVFVALIVGFVVGYLIARTRYIQKISVISEDLMQSANQVTALNGKMNRYEMLDGKMMQIKDGNLSLMAEDATLPDGTTISMTGEVITKDGSHVMMGEGDWITMNGTMMTSQ